MRSIIPRVLARCTLHMMTRTRNLPPAHGPVLSAGICLSCPNPNERNTGLGVRCSPELVDKARNSPENVTDNEWKQLLSSMQYQVARQHGTERAWSGYYNDHKEKGTYTCVCCGEPLFPSDTKYNSGSGWPSFYDTLKKDAKNDGILRKRDVTFGMVRVEVQCQRCKAHLGHVFQDGPNPTGLRYCINSASLNFVKKEEQS